MHDQVNRRQFLKRASVLSLGALSSGAIGNAVAMAEEPGRPATRPAVERFKVSLNAYNLPL